MGAAHGMVETFLNTKLLLRLRARCLFEYHEDDRCIYWLASFEEFKAVNTKISKAGGHILQS